MMTGRNVSKLYWKAESVQPLLVAALQKDHALVSSTDTVYGLLGRLSEPAYELLCRIKLVKERRPFLILVSSFDQANLFVDMEGLDEHTKRFIYSCWPGPVTFIFNARCDLARFMVSSKGTVALRAPDHEGLQDLLSTLDGLFSTSANKSGEAVPRDCAAIDRGIIENVDYLVVDRDDKQSIASTIVDLTTRDDSKAFPFTIVRIGWYSRERLKELYEQAKQP